MGKYCEMQNRKQNIPAIVLCVFWLALSVASWLHSPQDISLEERRKLAQRPEAELASIVRGTFMTGFEEYAKDQFPGRFGLRKMKALLRTKVLGHADSNGIYVLDNYAAKLEYPLNESSVEKAMLKFRYVYDTYLQGTDSNIYASVIPDKNYYLGSRRGYPSIDYDQMFRLVRDGMPYAEYIDIADSLTIEDFYRSDIHWRQENLHAVVRKLSDAIGFDAAFNAFERRETGMTFLGVYAGQSALSLLADPIVLLASSATDNSAAYDVETGTFTPVYNMERLVDRDPYDVYLSGAAPIVIVDNPEAALERELILFRDSFASSLAPLLLHGYSRITLIDIRYIRSDMLSDYITFKDQDVLFLYNALLLNASNVLK